MLALLPALVLTQAWVQLNPAHSPPGRVQGGITFDADRGVVVMTGGANTNQVADLWEWDGTDWADRTPDGGTTLANGLAIAFFPPRHTSVACEGFSSCFEWDGAHWSPLPEAAALISGAPMVYDAARGVLVAFGGGDGTGHVLDTTLTWDGGSAWTSTVVPHSPSAREFASMAYDSQRQRVMLFGGEDLTTRFHDLWEWDGASWIERTPDAGGPLASDPGAPMAYDSDRGVTVLYSFGTTWEWDGAGWKLIAVSNPPARHEALATYDPVRREVVLFGGQIGGSWPNETWVYRAWADAGFDAGLDAGFDAGVDAGFDAGHVGGGAGGGGGSPAPAPMPTGCGCHSGGGLLSLLVLSLALRRRVAT